jgi:hypothetical protein
MSLKNTKGIDKKKLSRWNKKGLELRLKKEKRLKELESIESLKKRKMIDLDKSDLHSSEENN